MPSLEAETPDPGESASTLTEDRLLAFLRRKLAGEPLPAAATAHFHDADIYTADPATLTVGYQPAPAGKGEGGSWFFFTHVRPKSSSDHRKKRMVSGGAGTWHSERAPRAVLDDEGNCVGHSQYFSYKRKVGKNCSERTDWYMVEFSEGQEGDHERVHGGEPVLVLSKIYKAHSGSRSSSSSRSARKRKATDEHVDQFSAPMKAKRRLFDSPAPTLAAASQEQVSSKVIMATSRLESQGEAAKFEQEAYHSKISGTLDHLVFWASQGKIDSTADYFKFSPYPEASASQSKTSTTDPSLLMSEPESQGKIGGTSDRLRFWPEPEASEKIDGTSDYLKFSSETEALQKTSPAPPSLLMSEPESHGKIGGASDYLRFGPEPEALEKIGGTSDYLRFSPETEALQKTSITSPGLLMFEPEAPAPQCEMATFDWGIQIAGGAPPAPVHCYGMEEALQKTSTTPPNLLMFETEVLAPQGETATFDRGIQMAGGAPPAPAHCYGTAHLMDDGYNGFPVCGGDAWFAGVASAPNVCRMPSSSLLPPPVSPSSWFGGPALWSY